MVRIAIDCMGGDGGPQTMIKGALQGNIHLKDTHLIFVGPKDQLNSIISNTEKQNQLTYEVVDAQDVITNEDSPGLAVRRKKDSSLVKAANLVKTKEADAFITTGSTGAYLSAGLLIVGRIKGIRRPALAAVLPNLEGGGKGSLFLDCGANMDATANDLVNYATMGDVYVKRMLKKPNPTVALLNVGTEDKKGNEVIKKAFLELKDTKLNFIGNIEARDMINCPADIVVCDGFAGNVALKTFEGAAKSLLKELKGILTTGLVNKLCGAVLKPSLLRLKEKLDYNKQGGGFLLGLKGLCIKCHGSSTPDAIQVAVEQVYHSINNDIINKITAELKK